VKVEEVVVLESEEVEAIAVQYRQLAEVVPGNSESKETNTLEFVEAEVEEQGVEAVPVLTAAEVEAEVAEVEVEVEEVEAERRMDLTLLRTEPEIAVEETSAVTQGSDSRSALD